MIRSLSLRFTDELFSTFLADGCDKKRCDFYATCETDEMGRAECVCPKACAKVCFELRTFHVKKGLTMTDGADARNFLSQ